MPTEVFQKSVIPAVAVKIIAFHLDTLRIFVCNRVKQMNKRILRGIHRLLLLSGLQFSRFIPWFYR